MADSSPLRVLLVGVASGDLDRLRRRVAASPLVEVVGATTVEQGVPSLSHDAVLLTPAALARMQGIRQRSAAPVPPTEALTTRERDVLAYVAEGHGNREIAQILGISEHTVKFHLASIYGKLGVGNRTEAAQHALRTGLLEI